MKGLSGKTRISIKHIETDNTVVTARGKWERTKEGHTRTDRDFTLGNGHTVRCTDGVLLNCALGTYMVLWTS